MRRGVRNDGADHLLRKSQQHCLLPGHGRYIAASPFQSREKDSPFSQIEYLDITTTFLRAG
jgi:hypothetical protein